MRKVNDYMYHRRGFGAHTKLDPLVNKFPSSAGVPPKTNKPKTLMSQSLLKGNSMYNKKPQQPETSPTKVVSPPIISKMSPVDENITIHVTDERK
jgi:hypothetical protein